MFVVARLIVEVEFALEGGDLALVFVDAHFEARQLLFSCGSNVCDFFFVACLHFDDAVCEGGMVGLLRGQITSDFPDPPVLFLQLLASLLKLAS